MTYVITLVIQNHTSVMKADALNRHSNGSMLNYVFTVAGAVVALFLYSMQLLFLSDVCIIFETAAL